MNLSFRFARAFTILVFFVLTTGFTILYFAFERATMRSAILKLEDLNAYVANKLAQDSTYDYLTIHHRQTQVKILPSDYKNTKEKIIEEKYIWNKSVQSYINKITVITYPVIHKKRYAITSVRYITIIENHFLISIIMVVAWIMVFLIILTIIVGVLVSKKILEPFYHAIEEIKKFSLKNNRPMSLMKTETEEFKSLNRFLLKMSESSKKDYHLLEELSENTSHELQTPLASIKGKIELLMDSDLSEKQLLTLSSMNDELDRLSSINQSLILLAKLEHFEKSESNHINFSELLSERLQYFEDIFEIQNLSLTRNIREEVYLNFDENLAIIVINNLINNAKRHNIENGKIRVTLTEDYFEISNTGNPPTIPTEELFKRFKRGNPDQNSIGIGLALVKKILEIYDTEITYHFENNFHTLKINFIK
ncbi:sensor histidine kinase [Chryseobacterium sp. PTM-20240506]|uniref:sensor histidine kinase n=1 Tax=unclassified Chryseobacterium TaxID=2593645 RepID=UPI002359268A|nr:MULTISPECIES: HAMP domain-containing sensor histidine kinase [unclassified Chryseobacterium]MDC8105429.1 HAMP domain-containing histidine kinase [Chryseobacterium sp. B21-037]MDQ1805684.1 HAMP domain-containing sensor histidine kinase [Chryseobacterium sp. CKR4-1]